MTLWERVKDIVERVGGGQPVRDLREEELRLAAAALLVRASVIDGRIEPRSVVTVSVSADHRATDGRDAGLFLTAVDRALQTPEAL